MPYLYILLGILGVAIVITIIVTLAIEYTKRKIYKEVNTKENLLRCEDILAKYIEDNGIAEIDYDAICEKVSLEIKEVSQFSKKLGGAEAVIDKNGQNGYIVHVADNLDEKKNRFAVAHELGHVIMGDALPVGRKGHGIFIRSKEEQLRDYIAAAILLPFKEFNKLLNEAEYFTSNEKQKLKFIDDISQSRKVDRELVIKRIMECKIMAADS